MKRTASQKSVLIWTMFALTLSGCEWPTMFPGPISEPDVTEIGNRLVGSWYAMPPNDWWGKKSRLPIYYLNIGLSQDKLLNGVIIVTAAQPGSVHEDEIAIWFAGTAWPSIVDDAVYYNVRLKNDRQDDFVNRCPATPLDCYIVGRVSFPDKDRLVLHAIGGKAVETLIKEGKVPGKHLGKMDNGYYLDISGTDIASLLLDYPGDELFQVPDEPVVFHRLKPTITEP